MLGMLQIKTDGNVINLGRVKLDLIAAQELVKTGTDRGIIELVHLANKSYSMFVHEEGLLYDLPYNAKASAISGLHIVGDAIIVENEKEDFE